MSVLLKYIDDSTGISQGRLSIAIITGPRPLYPSFAASLKGS